MESDMTSAQYSAAVRGVWMDMTHPSHPPPFLATKRDELQTLHDDILEIIDHAARYRAQNLLDWGADIEGMYVEDLPLSSYVIRNLNRYLQCFRIRLQEYDDAIQAL